MQALWITLIVLGSLAVLLLCVALFFFCVACVRVKPKKQKVNASWDRYMQIIGAGVEYAENAPGEEIVRESFDGLKLYAKVFSAKASKRTVVAMHGYRSRGFNDYGHVIKEYLDNGYNVIVPDERACGKSEGRYITFGVRERRDCEMWINYAFERFGQDGKVFLHGLSMGCATVMMTLGLPIASRVSAVVADCGFTSPYDIFCSVIRLNYKLPSFPIVNVAGLWCKLIAGFGIKECYTPDILKNNHVPIFFIHGQKDTFVPVWMTDKNFEANAGEKYYLKAENSTHATSFFDEPERCKREVNAFLNNR